MLTGALWWLHGDKLYWSKYVKWFSPACWQQRCKKQTDAGQVDSADRKHRADFGLEKKEAWRNPGEGQTSGHKGPTTWQGDAQEKMETRVWIFGEQGNLSLNGLLSLVCRWWQGGSLALGCSTLWGLCSESKSCVVKKKPVGRASSKTFGEKPQGSRHQPGDVSFLKKLFKMKQWETEKQLIFQYISLGDYICINLYMYFLIKKIRIWNTPICQIIYTQ